PSRAARTCCANSKKSGRPARARETPAPQKNTTRPSSRAVSNSSGIDGPSRKNRTNVLTIFQLESPQERSTCDADQRPPLMLREGFRVTQERHDFVFGGAHSSPALPFTLRGRPRLFQGGQSFLTRPASRPVTPQTGNSFHALSSGKAAMVLTFLPAASASAISALIRMLVRCVRPGLA